MDLGIVGKGSECNQSTMYEILKELKKKEIGKKMTVGYGILTFFFF